jgi:ABC-type branched-subunit amino acid transport system substrate-binding protein
VVVAGIYAVNGNSMNESAVLWRDSVNRAGGLNISGIRYRVEIDVFDDNSTAAGAAAVGRRLVADVCARHVPA